MPEHSTHLYIDLQPFQHQIPVFRCGAAMVAMQVWGKPCQSAYTAGGKKAAESPLFQNDS